MRLYWLSMTAIEDILSVCNLYRALISGSSPLTEMTLNSVFIFSKLVALPEELALKTPIFNSLIEELSRGSSSGYCLAFSHKYLTRRRCESIPLILVISGFVIAILCTPVASNWMTVERLSVSGNWYRGSLGSALTRTPTGTGLFS